MADGTPFRDRTHNLQENWTAEDGKIDVPELEFKNASNVEEEVDNESDKENPFVSIPDIKIKTPRQQDSKEQRRESVLRTFDPFYANSFSPQIRDCSNLPENEPIAEFKYTPSITRSTNVFNLIPLEEDTETYVAPDAGNIEPKEEEVSNEVLNASANDTLILSSSGSSSNELQQTTTDAASQVFALAFSVIENLLDVIHNPETEEEKPAPKQADTSAEENLIVSDLLDTLFDDVCKEAKTNDIIKHFKDTNPLYELLSQAMADLGDTVAFQEQELCDFKLQLNQSQQARASLELQLRQKEEVILKTQAEAQKKEILYKQEIRQLQEKLKSKSNSDGHEAQISELQNTITLLKEKEEMLLGRLKAQACEEDSFRNTLGDYEKTISNFFSDIEKMKFEYDTTKRHLANIEVAFSDVHQKYERSKSIVVGYKNNEDILKQNLAVCNVTIRKGEEKYESLKVHAKTQIEKANKEISQERDKHEADVSRLGAMIKRLEIKIDSLENALEQKSKECQELSKLCDEVTGKVH